MKSRRGGSLRRLDALEKEWDTGRRSISEIAPCTRWQDFCGNTEIPDDLKEREPQRAALYKATAALVRTFANIAGELEAAGYTQPKIGRIKQAIDRHVKLREIIRNASGESLHRHAGAPRPLQQPQPRPGLGPEGRRSDQAKPPRQLARPLADSSANTPDPPPAWGQQKSRLGSGDGTPGMGLDLGG